MPAKGHRKPDVMRIAPPIKLYVTACERVEILTDAATRTMTATALVRAIIARHYSRATPTLKARRDQAPLLRELTRIGNNLNQLVKQGHEGVVPVNPTRVHTVLDQLMSIFARL